MPNSSGQISRTNLDMYSHQISFQFRCDNNSIPILFINSFFLILFLVEAESDLKHNSSWVDIMTNTQEI